jgi:predicted NBD/HSP70 family sugar kinase
MLAAGPAIATVAQKAPDDSRLLEMARQRETITAQLVCAAAAEGDPFALMVIGHAATYVGIGIASLLNILTPGVVILGAVSCKVGHSFGQALRLC